MRTRLLYVLLVVACGCKADSDSREKMRPGDDPMPGLCLDEEEEKLKFVGESCKTDDDCYNLYNTTACKNSVCTCAEDYIPEDTLLSSGNTKKICTMAPYGLNTPCTSKCAKPFNCSVAPFTDVDGDGDNDSDFFGDGPMKVCLCPEPYVVANDSCILNCKTDEVFYDGQCRKRCATNELFYGDGSCKKMANLGEACSDKHQCSTPFAECKDEKCTCSSGFKANANNNGCETTSYSCPNGEPAKANGAVIQCTVVKGTKTFPAAVQSNGPPANALTDTCPDGQYCVVTNGGGYSEGSAGFCCPFPKLACPVGSPHPTATCDFSTNPQEKDKKVLTCPFDSHSCQTIPYGDTASANLCCPDQCSFRTVLVNNRCYPTRDHGDQCDFNQQCSGFQGICENGKCVCPKNLTTTSYGSFTICTLTCQDDEVESFGQCKKLLKLDDKCDPESSDSNCPPQSHCSPRSSKCICDCGMVRLDGKTCAPPPRCPDPTNNSSSPFSDTSVKVDPTKATFCAVFGDEEPLLKTAAKECPAGQYCHNYLPNLGLCCSRPAQLLCPDGDVPSKKCDPSVWMECGSKGKCVKVLDSVGQKDFTDGYVCCKRDEDSMEATENAKDQ